MKQPDYKIEYNELTEDIVIDTGRNRTVITPDFQEEIYEIVAMRKAREVLKNSELIRSVTSEEEIIEKMVPFYLYRQEKSNEKDSEDFCWLALVDYDMDVQREEEDLETEEELVSAEIMLD